MPDTVTFLSLGAGVQSSTLALMCAAGEITPLPRAAIFADTQAEPRAVYEWLDWLERRLPYPVHRVTAGSLTDSAVRPRVSGKTGLTYFSPSLPVFTVATQGVSVQHGKMPRQCTRTFKVDPVQRMVRKLTTRSERSDGIAMLLGISADEWPRAKPSRKPWITNIYPLLDRNVTRADCLAWMSDHGHPRPPRSACVYCPFHSNAEWRLLRDGDPEGFAAAVAFERSFRAAVKSVPKTNRAIEADDLFLHTDRVPLDEVNLDAQDSGPSLWATECDSSEGMCGA